MQDGSLERESFCAEDVFFGILIFDFVGDEISEFRPKTRLFAVTMETKTSIPNLGQTHNTRIPG